MPDQTCKSVAFGRKPLKPGLTLINEGRLPRRDTVDPGREEEAAIRSNQPPPPVHLLGPEPTGGLLPRTGGPTAKPIARRERRLRTQGRSLLPCARNEVGLARQF